MSDESAETLTSWADAPEAELLRRKRMELEEEREAETRRYGTPIHWSPFSPPWLLEKILRLTGLRRVGERFANQPVLRSFTAAHPRVTPALEGFRILHISDLHFDDRPGFLKAATGLLRGIECDLCVVTGDYRFHNTGPAINIFDGMRTVLDSVSSRFGCYGILGNHDRLEYVPRLEQAGLKMLVNRGEAIEVGDATIWLAGTDDPHFYRCDDLNLAMHRAPDDAFVVGLIHTPEIVKEAARRGVHLYLCGHTHGGQVCLPGRIPVYVNARCAYRYARGPWRHKGMLGYTTAGLGTTDLPVRFFCPPEALLFTLRSGDPAFVPDIE